VLDPAARRPTRALRIARAAAQRLHRPRAATPDEIVRHLLAAQAQDLAAARLALRARGEGFAAADVDAALSDERSVVVAWLGRGTLHLVASEDYPWLLGLAAPARFAANRRRLAEEGVATEEAERAVSLVERALADHGPLTRAELGERIARTGIRTEGQALPHLLMLAALRGTAVLGPLEAGKQAFVLARDWLGVEPAVDLDRGGAERGAGLAELARRYLVGHGPAAPADLAAWVGLPLRDAHTGLRAIGCELIQLDGGLVDLAARDPVCDGIAPRLLPAFDPYLLGWKDRSFAVPPEHARRVHPGGGMLRPVATAGGAAVGTWRARRAGSRLTIQIDAFEELKPEVAAALESECHDVARFEGLALAGTAPGSIVEDTG
jgi:hypothetical protein